MPDLDGYGLIREVRRFEVGRERHSGSGAHRLCQRAGSHAGYSRGIQYSRSEAGRNQ